MRKGSKMSAEARQKISERLRAHNPMRGRKMTDEQRAAHAERLRTSERARLARERLADSRRGKPRRPFSDPVAHSAALSRALKGKPHNVKRRVRFNNTVASIVLALPEFPGCLPENGAAVDHLASVYAIINLTNNKVYVGSSVNTEQRWFVHRIDLNAGRHHSPALQRAWNKYGASAFSFRLLEVVADRAVLVEREQYWIGHLHASNRTYGYNISPTANFGGGGAGERNARAKLKDADIPVIRARLAAGEGQATLAREYGISKSTMWQIAHGKVWTHIP